MRDRPHHHAVRRQRAFHDVVGNGRALPLERGEADRRLLEHEAEGVVAVCGLDHLPRGVDDLGTDSVAVENENPGHGSTGSSPTGARRRLS